MRRRRRVSAVKRRASREQWALLSPWKRKLIAEEMPNDLEREEEYRRRTISALEYRNGPMQWDATLAVLAEGEAEDIDRMTAADREPDGMTFQEIGDVLASEDGSRIGLSTTRVQQIFYSALRKMRKHPIILELLLEQADTEPRTASIADINAAIARASVAA